MKVSKELFETVQGSKFGGDVKVVIEDDMVKYYVIDASVSISLNDFFFMCKKLIFMMSLFMMLMFLFFF